MRLQALAPAKLNLALHVTGRRDDGYHLLDSLVVFAATGDRLTVEPAADLSLTVTGPGAALVPAGDDNLVLRAARLLSPGRGARIVLDKHLPAAAGIGGGSSDAATTLRLLARLWDLPLPDPQAVARLGADVPVCLAARPLRMSGIGERLAEVPALPPLHVVLVNPRQPVETPAVFRALTRRDGTPMPARLPAAADAGALAALLAGLRNDLEEPARRVAPVIGDCLAALAATPDCLLARMSGSGATCFGIYATAPGAEAAARNLRADRPGWWIAAAPLLGAPPPLVAVSATDQETRATT